MLELCACDGRRRCWCNRTLTRGAGGIDVYQEDEVVASYAPTVVVVTGCASDVVAEVGLVTDATGCVVVLLCLLHEEREGDGRPGFEAAPPQLHVRYSSSE